MIKTKLKRFMMILRIISAKENEREDFSILLILFNLNSFSLDNLLEFIPDLTISQLHKAHSIKKN